MRILILGSSGAGKTTFARRLGSLLDVEVIHLDEHFWGPNWEPSTREAWDKKLSSQLEKKSWVMDGNYPKSLKRRLARATSAILLDIPRPVCLFRCGKRLVQNWGRSRDELAPGCVEKMDWDFFKWIWNYPHVVRPGIMTQLANLPLEKQVVILKSDFEIAIFLQKMEKQGSISQFNGRSHPYAIR
jgi:adenylate kinase family enzyme